MISQMISSNEFKFNSVCLKMKESIGSGFFISFTLQDNSKIIGIITNYHVVKNSDSVSFGIHTKSEEFVSIKTALSRKSYFGTSEILNEEYMDIIFMPFLTQTGDSCRYYDESLLVGPYPPVTSLEIKTIDESQVLTEEYYELLGGAEEVYIYGYPYGNYDKYNNTARFLRGNISSIAHENYNGEKVFTVSSNARPGNSGSPVIWVQNREVKLIGIVRSGKESENHTECIKTDFLQSIIREFKELPLQEVW